MKLREYCVGISGILYGRKSGVSAFYINTNKNEDGDKKSRKLRNNLEWSLKTPIFDEITLV